MARALRVVIIDDASTYRRIMNIVVGDIPGIECVGEFADGLAGIRGIEELQPNIVFLDIEMPIMSGLDVLQEVNRRFPAIGVIMVSGFDKKQADITIKALEMGAIDFVSKPNEASVEANIQVLKKKIAPLLHVFSTKLNLEKVKQITSKTKEEITAEDEDSKKVQKTKDLEKSLEKSAKKAIELTREKASEKSRKQGILTVPFPIHLVAIGTSTGGPYALSELIPYLPADFPVPIVIVQHMPPNFTASLATSLTKKSKLPVCEARFGDIVVPGKILLAPGGYHMVIKTHAEIKDRLLIDIVDTPSVHGCKPSVDVLFKSIAQNFNGNVLSVVMTGMGSDGTEGVRALKAKKCYSIIQDEESCVVFGMPKMILQSKLSDEIVPLKDLANRITEIVKNSR